MCACEQVVVIGALAPGVVSLPKHLRGWTTFVVATQARVWLFAALTAESRVAWLEHLQRVVPVSCKRLDDRQARSLQDPSARPLTKWLHDCPQFDMSGGSSSCIIA